MLHDVHDAVGLEIGRRIAAGLADHPECVDLAKANVEHWSKLNSDSPGLLRCYDEWRKLLQRAVREIVAVLAAETDEGQRLRQNSPFAGVLSVREVREIKRRHHEAARGTSKVSPLEPGLFTAREASPSLETQRSQRRKKKEYSPRMDTNLHESMQSNFLFVFIRVHSWIKTLLCDLCVSSQRTRWRAVNPEFPG
jgi:hypothetical protein